MIAHSPDQRLRVELIDDQDVFDALANEQRRRLLVDLLDSDLQRVSDLSDTSRELVDAHDALFEQIVSGKLEIDGANSKLIQKHRVHLPKLEEYGFIEWNRTDRLVARGPRFDELKPILEQVKRQRVALSAIDQLSDRHE